MYRVAATDRARRPSLEAAFEGVWPDVQLMVSET
jgi:hypothetical protein